MANDLTAERVRELFHYDPATGRLARKVSCGQAIAGEDAGTVGSGHRSVTVDRQRNLAHRLIWLYVHGAWPEGEIDHINGDPLDNRLENLRDVSHRTNSENIRKPRTTNKVGALGVTTVFGNSGRYRARLRVGKERINLGNFDTPEEAHAAYVAAKRKHHAGCTL
jgi:hypothetical protein